MSNAPARTGYQCRILADSISPAGVRLSTLELRYPRMVHEEFLTHRCLSRNSRSARAMPADDAINEVIADPARPARWTRNGKGMVAPGDVDSEQDALASWLIASELAVASAKVMVNQGLHKQIVNRVLASYAWIWTVATATQEGWDSFLNLRVAPDVDPTLLPLAVRIGRTLRDSTPRHKNAGEWHLPYITDEESETYYGRFLALASAGRCRRVSIRPFDGSVMDIDADVARGSDCITKKHWSPLEHQGEVMEAATRTPIHSRNFISSWLQHRALHDVPRGREPFNPAHLDAYPTDGHFGDAAEGGAA